MAVPYEANDKDTAPPEDSIMNDTKETLYPQHTTTKTNTKAQELKDISIRYEIPVQVGHSIEDHLKLHNQLLQVLSAAFDTTNLHILDKKYQHVQNFDDSRWLDKDYYDSHFNHHVDIGERMVVIEHSIRSTQTLLTIQKDLAIASFFKRNKNLAMRPIQGLPNQEHNHDYTSIQSITCANPRRRRRRRRQ
jgi:hypothetical protein